MIRRKAAEEKVVFSIKIHEVVLKKVERALERDPISVTLERGKHTVHTPDKDVRIAANGDATIIFNESLQFDATMTQEKGQYAEKSGKLILRRKKKGMMGSSFQEIGHVPLLFHLLLNDGLPQTKSMLLEKCTYPGSQVKITIDCQYAEVSHSLPLHCLLEMMLCVEGWRFGQKHQLPSRSDGCEHPQQPDHDHHPQCPAWGYQGQLIPIL